MELLFFILGAQTRKFPRKSEPDGDRGEANGEAWPRCKMFGDTFIHF